MDRHTCRQISWGENRHAIPLDYFISLAWLDVPSSCSCQVDDHRAALHSIDCCLVHQQRRPAPRNLSSCNYHVSSLRVFRNQVPASLQCFFRQLDRVTTRVFSLESAQVHIEKSCPERSHLFTGGGANVVRFNHSSEAPRGGNCLQACHAGSQHQHTRGRNCAGGRHQQGKHSGNG